MPNIGVINEIGDMGLGFNELNKKDKALYESQNGGNNTSESSKDNDKKNHK